MNVLEYSDCPIIAWARFHSHYTLISICHIPIHAYAINNYFRYTAEKKELA